MPIVAKAFQLVADTLEIPLGAFSMELAKKWQDRAWEWIDPGGLRSWDTEAKDDDTASEPCFTHQQQRMQFKKFSPKAHGCTCCYSIYSSFLVFRKVHSSSITQDVTFSEAPTHQLPAPSASHAKLERLCFVGCCIRISQCFFAGGLRWCLCSSEC